SCRMNTELTMIPPAKPIIGQEERDAVDRVLASGMVAQGPEVVAFEEEVSAAVAGGREAVAVSSGSSGRRLGVLGLGLGRRAAGRGAEGPEVVAVEEACSAAVAGGREVVAVNSGTSGQHLGMLALGLGPGDEVIVPSFTFAATANTVAVCGATPVFVDVDPETFTIDPAAVEAAVTERTVGLQPVHLYGHPAPMDQLLAVADRHGLWVFEDAAQAHGATWQGEQVGTFGQGGMFSLYPTKNMTSGEGGMVSCAS